MSDRVPFVNSDAEESLRSELPTEPSASDRRMDIKITPPVPSTAGDSSYHHSYHTANNNHHYEELMGGSVPCPSCNGSGRIPKERERQLVALIPVNDKRLKPRRTWLWVLLGMGACMLICGLLLFFLLPRSLDVDSASPPIEEVTILYYKEHERLTLNFINVVNVTNSNYYSVLVTNASSAVINRFQPWLTEVIGTGWNKTGAQVPMLSSTFPLSINYTVNLEGPTLNYCESFISRIISLYVLMEFDITVTFEYLNRREQDTLTITQQVCCVPSGNCTATDHH